MKRPSFINALRRYFIAGLLVWLPVWVTLLVIRFVFDIMDQSLALLPKSYQPAHLLGYSIPGLGVLMTLLLLLLTGMAVANFLGRRLVALWEAIVRRIPLVRSIYTGVKQALNTVLSSSGKSFRQVVLLQYPKEGIWTIGFLTNTGLDEVEKQTGESMLIIFIPTTPNPTSGFLVFVPKSKVITLDMSVDKALRMLISLGIISPNAP